MTLWEGNGGLPNPAGFPFPNGALKLPVRSFRAVAHTSKEDGYWIEPLYDRNTYIDRTIRTNDILFALFGPAMLAETIASQIRF